MCCDAGFLCCFFVSSVFNVLCFVCPCVRGAALMCLPSFVWWRISSPRCLTEGARIKRVIKDTLHWKREGWRCRGSAAVAAWLCGPLAVLFLPLWTRDGLYTQATGGNAREPLTPPTNVPIALWRWSAPRRPAAAGPKTEDWFSQLRIGFPPLTEAWWLGCG